MFASSVYAPGNNFTRTQPQHLTSSALNRHRQPLVKLKMLKYPHALQKRPPFSTTLGSEKIRLHIAAAHAPACPLIPPVSPQEPLPSSGHLSFSGSLPEWCIFRTTSNLQKVLSVSRTLRGFVQSFSFQVGPFILNHRVYTNRTKHIKAMASEVLP